MAKEKWDKKRCERAHAAKRAMERYGLPYNRIDRRQIAEQISKSNDVKCTWRASFLWKQSQRVSVWKVFLRGKPVIACFDKQRQEVITFLPPDAKKGDLDKKGPLYNEVHGTETGNDEDGTDGEGKSGLEGVLGEDVRPGGQHLEERPFSGDAGRCDGSHEVDGHADAPLQAACDQRAS